MKKGNNKKIIIVLLIIAIVAVLGIVYGVSMSNKVDPEAKAEAYISKAMFGSIVEVRLTDKGINAYSEAKKYEIHYDGKLASATSKIGETTTVFPARKAGDKVEIHLLTSSDEEIDIVKTKLIKNKDKKQ
jgi:hypothetical protein